ncbi:MAG: efflux RND transporter periplasmic adaptor subunit [Phycisphaerae bacterium]
MKIFSSLLSAALIISAAVAGFFIISACNKPAPTGNPEISVVPAAATGDCPHGLLKAECGFCTPELNESMGFCAGHDVSEALCWVCNPKVITAYKSLDDWCAAHGLPESRCDICKGESKPANAQTPPVEGQDRLFAAPDPDCHINQTLVQLKSSEIAERADLETEPVVEREISGVAECNAETTYNANLFAKLAPRVSGVVHSVAVDLGARVSKGQVLAVIDSPELASAKAEYLHTRALVSLYEASHERYLSLSQKGLTTEIEIHESLTKLAEGRIAVSRARASLRALGLDDDSIEAVVAQDDVGSLLSITAPFDGQVVERNAVVGEVVDRQMPLLAIADTSTMWAMLDWPDPSAPIEPGQRVMLEIDGVRGRTFEGVVTWVSPSADPRTRTLHARAEFPNEDGALRANMFGRAQVRARVGRSMLVVPRSAVQWDGSCNVVFVQSGPGEYYAQPVELREGSGDAVEALSGVEAGQQVVTRGAFLLKTEILKGEIGAGCCAAD